MYDQPILGGYEQALQLSGSPQRARVHVQRHRAGRTGVPERAPAAGTLAQQSPWAIDPDSRSPTPGRATSNSSGRSGAR